MTTSYTCSRGSSCSQHSSPRSLTPTPAKRPRLEYDSGQTNYTYPTEPVYSPTMPPFSPEPMDYTPTPINRPVDGPTFPQRPIHISTNPGRDTYAFLHHDPRTLFAGVPSIFSRTPDARYAAKLRKKALQIGCPPGNVRFCVDGHTAVLYYD